MTRIVGIDTGGTYTDLVAYDPNEGSLTYSKTPTEQSDLAGGAIACLTQAAISPDNLDILKHGTTQVINAFIGRGGAPTALLTTVGFRDLLEITRGNRPIAFQLQFEKETPLVPADLRFEVGERMDGTGAILQPLDLAGLEPIARELKKRKIQALAISFLNAYLNPHHEELAATWFRENMPGLFVSIGTELSREWFEYERTSTTVANAYVGPGMKRYLDSLTSGLRERGYGANIHMMASNGGVLTPAQAQAQPVALVESGPVGGCIGAGAFAEAMNLPRIVAFDMGGTTAKCALIEDGAFEVLPTYYIGGYARGYPVRSAVLDIAEVGAGGGSIVSVSTQGRLRV
ncbi:MAG: hydantoinase/oxoprolinase family protein, partial [Rhodospirillales bacterium]|nr:hydantoinase/oxoprolinase family protein [Rhodospirillales bacterium]